MSDSINKSFVGKSKEHIASDAKIIDSRIATINNTPSIITHIKEALNISCDASIFRPRADLGMLLFKPDAKSASVYTLNLLTLKPTSGSPIKEVIPIFGLS
jgi:hypothetical protein